MLGKDSDRRLADSLLRWGVDGDPATELQKRSRDEKFQSLRSEHRSNA